MKFLRYPGGKRKLLSFLVNYLPQNGDLQGKYIEPFVGGGSVFFFLHPQQALLADLNKDLIDLYKGIRNYPHKVWEIFQSFPEGKKTYYKIRNEDLTGRHLSYRAARTLYLNRTCFKGMWRHGPQGHFNVGYGGEERRWVLTHEDIVALSKRLKTATVLQADFGTVLKHVTDGDFIFLDPPYKPGEKEMQDVHYLHKTFSFEDQIRLAKKLQEISKNVDVRWVMTNSSHPDIAALYKEFYIVIIPKGTGPVVGVSTNNSQEILISNQPL